ncbi:MAG TPA: exodeoxyribonuclease VII small subunit [Clostridia bacterium]|nr:exodeoxyribonuclease VII small subunit [Clostridia bacterium]
MKNKTFEQSITRLEEIVAILEDGNIPVDDTLKYFEEGIKLAEFCNTRLDKAKQKIVELSKLEAEDENAEQPR